MSKIYEIENIEKIVLDTGVVYIKIKDVAEEVLLAPTRGGSTFTADREWRIIERDGARGKEKGLRRVVKENAQLVVNLLDLSQDNLKYAFVGAKVGEGDGEITSGGVGVIDEDDYLEHVKWLGETLDGGTKEIYLYNCLHDEPIEIGTTDDDEVVLQLTFSAHHDPTDFDVDLYEIKEIDPTT